MYLTVTKNVSKVPKKRHHDDDSVEDKDDDADDPEVAGNHGNVAHRKKPGKVSF